MPIARHDVEPSSCIVTIQNAWVQELPSGAMANAGYMTLVNAGPKKKSVLWTAVTGSGLPRVYMTIVPWFHRTSSRIQRMISCATSYGLGQL